MSSRQNIHGQPFHKYVLIRSKFNQFPISLFRLTSRHHEARYSILYQSIGQYYIFPTSHSFSLQTTFDLVSHIYICMHWRIQGGGRGTRTPSPSLGPISFIFMLFSAKNLPNNRFLPQTQRFAPNSPPRKYWIRHRHDIGKISDWWWVTLMNSNATLPTSFIQKNYTLSLLI